MIRLLPVLIIIALIIGGLGYWRFVASSKNLVAPSAFENEGPIEVPKTLPEAPIEDKVKDLQDTITKLVNEVNSLSSPKPFASSDTEVNSLSAQVTELKVRVSALEQSTPAPAATSSQSVVYIPLGSGGVWGSIDWYSTTEYEISLDPANYPGYTGMVLEVTSKLAEAAGTGSVRLYNTTDNSATSSQLDFTSTTYTLKTSPSFQLPSGSKTYKLQVKSTSQKDLYIQSARIRVNF